jgi:hypothetical protein
MNVTMIGHCADQFEDKFYHKVNSFLVEILRNYSICIFFVRCILAVGIRLNCFLPSRLAGCNPLFINEIGTILCLSLKKKT